MSDNHRTSLIARIGAFGIKTNRLASDDAVISAARVMFGVEGRTIDDVWFASSRISKKERSRRARSSQARDRVAPYLSAKQRTSFDEENVELDAECDERVMIAKARASVKMMEIDDPRRIAVEAFLRRRHWSGD